MSAAQIGDIFWVTITAVHLLLITGTFVPIIAAGFRGSRAYDRLFDSAAFQSSALQDAELTLVKQDFARMRPTITRWINRAAQLRRFHMYALLWIALNAILIPFLLTTVGRSHVIVQRLAIVMLLHMIVLLVANTLLSMRAWFQAYTNAEARYSECAARILERPESMGTPADRVQHYLVQVRQIAPIHHDM